MKTYLELLQNIKSLEDLDLFEFEIQEAANLNKQDLVTLNRAIVAKRGRLLRNKDVKVIV